MPEALPLQPGDPRRIGEYEITGRLGVGEHGTVFRGRAATGRDVAVKLLHQRLGGEPVARARFTGAFAAARRVTGFCTAAVLAADVENDRAHVVSEWVDGPSLETLVREEGPRGAAVLERLAVGTAIAFAAAHRAGAVHLDHTPRDLLLGRDGPRLTDLGLARALEAVNAVSAGRAADEPAFRAPEQLSGTGIGPAADVFAWAGTLLFAATGAPPFGEGTPAEVMQRIVYDDPDLSALPESLRPVLARAFAKTPGDRPTASHLLDLLLAPDTGLADRMPPRLIDEARALAGSPGAAPPPVDATTFDLPPAPAAEPPSVPVPDRGAGRYEISHDLSANDAATSAIPAVRADGDDATALIGTIARPQAAADDGTTVIPGLGGDEPGAGTAVMPALPPSAPPRQRRGNHVLGVALSLVIGVLVGVAIIALVLWPQMRGDDEEAPGGDPANVADNRPVTAVPASFAGTWKGTAVNQNSGVGFPVEVTFQEGRKTARAVYPREGCDGALALTRGTGSNLQMTLQIAKPCTPGHVQITRQPDGTLLYAWSRSTQGQPVGYQGRLTRAQN